jgi:hypothetical protein
VKTGRTLAKSSNESHGSKNGCFAAAEDDDEEQ